MVTTTARPLADLLPHDIAAFEEQTRLFLEQKIDAKTYVPMRTRNGVYATRQAGQHMVRVKLPAGLIKAEQLRVVADVLDDFSPSRRAHVTTRQDLQLYHLKLEHTPAVLRALALGGLTTRFAGGNSVRNVKCCPFAGLHETAPFDPTPYAQALADYFLLHTQEIEVSPGVVRSVGQLPRKFKISFGGCCGEDDCGQANINDLGFLAAVRRDGHGGEVKGFAIKAGGGLSNSPREGLLLNEFVPADEIIPWTEAVVRAYMLHGNYQGTGSRHKARLKHMIDAKGWDFFRGEVFRIRETLPRTVPLELERFIERMPAAPARALETTAGGGAQAERQFMLWQTGAVRMQRQPGFAAVTVREPLTDFNSAQLRALADAAATYGNGEVRLSDAQSVVLRHVSTAYLPALFENLLGAGLAVEPMPAGASLAACAGSDTCRIGITSSRDLLAEVEKWLQTVAPILERDRTIGPLVIRTSGCPSSCGQHHVATIGFHGEARVVRVNDKPRHVPMAVLYVGGSTNRTSVRFGRKIAAMPVCRAIEALDRIFNLFLDRRTSGQSFLAWSQRVDFLLIYNTIFDLTELDPSDERIFFDAGHASPFEISARGGGESGV